MGDALPTMALPVGRRVSLLETFSGAILDDLSSYDWRTSHAFNWGLKLRCGNGHLDEGEACDDGDLRAGDGCSAQCTVEPGFACTGDPSDCRTICGDGLLAGLETCDDGNQTPRDGCSATCTIEANWTCTYPNPCQRRDVDVRVAGAFASLDVPSLSWIVIVGICNLGSEEAIVPLSLHVVDTGAGEYLDDSRYMIVASESCDVSEFGFSLPSGLSLASAEIAADPHDLDPSNDQILATIPAPAHPLGIATPLTRDPTMTEVPLCNLGLNDESISFTAVGLISNDAVLDMSDPLGTAQLSDTLGDYQCTILQVPQAQPLQPGFTWFGARISVDGTLDPADPGVLGNPLMVGGP
jgi:cysteine-rich repeat protein